MLQVFQYQDNPITFDFDGEVMVNATEMAKKFGKQPAAFLRNAQTEAFISALQNRIPDACLVETINGGATFGTWMHQKLALKFAGWLSPDFELWMLDRIEELLTTGKAELNPMNPAEMKLQVFRMLEQEAESLKEQLQLANATIEKQAPAVMYATKVLQSNNCYTTTTIAKELGMGAPSLNQLLKDLNIQYKHDGHWVLYQQHQNKGYTQTRTHTYYDQENKQQSSLQTVWTEKGRAYIHKRINQYKAA